MTILHHRSPRRHQKTLKNTSCLYHTHHKLINTLKQTLATIVHHRSPRRCQNNLKSTSYLYTRHKLINTHRQTLRWLSFTTDHEGDTRRPLSTPLTFTHMPQIDKQPKTNLKMTVLHCRSQRKHQKVLKSTWLMETQGKPCPCPSSHQRYACRWKQGECTTQRWSESVAWGWSGQNWPFSFPLTLSLARGTTSHRHTYTGLERRCSYPRVLCLSCKV